jgi:8-oxo-dGTP pyrophosphatase MutT (NUDIX family)
VVHDASPASGTVTSARLTDGVVALRPVPAAGGRSGPAPDPRLRAFAVEHAGEDVGAVELHEVDDGVGSLTWRLYAGHNGKGHATRALHLLTEYALIDLALYRVEARIDPRDRRSLRLASRAGLRREGVVRSRSSAPHLSGLAAHVLLGRLATDPPISEPDGFRELLNATLPRKRAISQLLVRDPDGRVLLCQLTYKVDWDLPGGVVEPGESPRVGVGRETSEELGLAIEPGRLLLTDWLPPWGGWDDAVGLVFDGGVLHPSALERVTLAPKEIRSVEFCTPEQVAQRAADFTTRRISAALAVVDDPGERAAYTESGRPS